MILKKLFQRLRRFRQPILFPNLDRQDPVSPIFGLERGKPVDRYYIEKFLSSHKSLIKGKILEVGESRYSRLFGEERADSVNVLHFRKDSGKGPMTGDLTDLSTLPREEIDTFICTQTLNFVFDLPQAAEGIHHLLKPGGSALITVAGISQISRYDMDRWGDYWRFTTASLEKLFSPLFGKIEISSFGNALAATALLQGIAVEDLPRPSLLEEPSPDYQVLIGLIARKEEP